MIAQLDIKKIAPTQQTIELGRSNCCQHLWEWMRMWAFVLH